MNASDWEEIIKFSIGQKVKFVVGDRIGIITGIYLRKKYSSYLVTWSNDLSEKCHYDFELIPFDEPNNPPGFKP